jgi:hypothetical protein
MTSHVFQTVLIGLYSGLAAQLLSRERYRICGVLTVVVVLLHAAGVASLRKYGLSDTVEQIFYSTSIFCLAGVLCIAMLRLGKKMDWLKEPASPNLDEDGH